MQHNNQADYSRITQLTLSVDVAVGVTEAVVVTVAVTVLSAVFVAGRGCGCGCGCDSGCDSGVTVAEDVAVAAAVAVAVAVAVPIAAAMAAALVVCESTARALLLPCAARGVGCEGGLRLASVVPPGGLWWVCSGLACVRAHGGSHAWAAGPVGAGLLGGRVGVCRGSALGGKYEAHCINCVLKQHVPIFVLHVWSYFEHVSTFLRFLGY